MRTDELIARESGESRNKIQRYIRLTNLIPQLLKMVDEERIAFSVGVELSYLDEYEQQDLLEAIELEDKPNQREKISFQYDELSKYFPKCSP